MGLQVWIPMHDGTLTNQGLDVDVVFNTNTGATINNNGKIGKCYSFDGVDDWVQAIFDKTKYSGKPLTLCLWFKCDKVKPGSSIIDIAADCAVTYTYNSNGIKFGFWRCYRNSSGSRAGSSSSISTYYDANIWHHIAVVYNGGITKIYVDGILSQTFDNSSLYNYNWTPLLASNYNKISIGKSTGTNTDSNNWIGGLINDVRIYDEALSPLEVKRIAQGLILHYPLNDNSIQQMNNCYNYPTFNTSTASGGWYHWGSSGHAGSYGQTTDKKYIYRSDQTYAHWVADGADATHNYLLYQSPDFGGGVRSLVAICKEENSKPITNNICYATWNARNGGVVNNSWTSIQSLGNGFYLCKCEGISQDGSNNLVGIYIKPGYKVYFSECYLENNRTVSSNIFYQDSIIYDCSGYCNNGQLYNYDSTGSIILEKNTPKYEMSTFINSENNTTNTAAGTVYIYGYCTLINPDKMSVAFWCKPIAGYGNSTGQGQFCTTNYEYGNTTAGADFQASAMNHRDNTIDINDATSTTQCRPYFAPVLNEWHHYVVTYDGQSGKVYKDGILQDTKSFSSPTVLDSFTGVIIGFSKAGGVWRSNKSYYSDFRIYATTLSAEDIMALYKESAYIANNGAMYTYEFIEE